MFEVSNKQDTCMEMERACMDDVNIRRGYSKAAERW